MVALIDHFEYIVTDNEAEALILECNLIKEKNIKTHKLYSIFCVIHDCKVCNACA